MICDGMKFRRNRFLGFRSAREGDRYAKDGSIRKENDPIERAYCVFFRVKDAEIVETNQGSYYKPDSVPSDKLLPISGHGLTSKAYGVTRRRTGGARDVFYTVGERAGQIIMPGEKYLEIPVYLARKGWVYQAVIRKPAEEADRQAA